jgi:hypothetical protein
MDDDRQCGEGKQPEKVGLEEGHRDLGACWRNVAEVYNRRFTQISADYFGKAVSIVFTHRARRGASAQFLKICVHLRKSAVKN